MKKNKSHAIHDEIKNYIYEEPSDIGERLSVAQYSGIEVNMDNVQECTDEEVEWHCRNLQIENAEVTDGIIKDDECLVTYDKAYSSVPYDPVVVPNPFPKDLNDAVAETGKAQFPELESWAIGQSVGYVLRYVEGIPSDYHIEEVAGHTLQVEAYLKIVKDIPQLTDEFIHTKVDPSCDTVVEYKAKYKRETQEIYNYQDYCDTGRVGFTDVRNKSEFDYNSDDMDYMMKSFLKEVCLDECKKAGFDYFDDYLVALGVTFDEFKQGNVNRAVNREKSKLIRDFIIEEESLVPSENEIRYVKFTRGLTDEEYDKLPEEEKEKELKIAEVNIFIADNCIVIRPFAEG